jgi:hypothetical protein
VKYWINSKKRQSILNLFAKTPLGDIGKKVQFLYGLWVLAGRPKIWRKNIVIDGEKCLLTVSKSTKNCCGFSEEGDIFRSSRIHVVCDSKADFVKVMLHEMRHIQQFSAIAKAGIKMPYMPDSGWKYLFHPHEIDARATELAYGFQLDLNSYGGKHEKELLLILGETYRTQASLLRRQLKS